MQRWVVGFQGRRKGVNTMGRSPRYRNAAFVVLWLIMSDGISDGEGMANVEALGRAADKNLLQEYFSEAKGHSRQLCPIIQRSKYL